MSTRARVSDAVVHTRRVDDGATQIGVVQSGARGAGTGQVGAAQHRFAQIGLDQAGLAQPTPAQVDTAKVVTPEHREREVHLVEGQRPHTTPLEYRAQHAALAKSAVPQSFRG
jgi:hypothetical protein